MDSLTKHRKARLLALIEGAPYRGNQQVFAMRAGLSKGRISQMLDPDESFGERSARALAGKLKLSERYFEDGFAASDSRAPVAAKHMDEGEDFVYWLNKIPGRDLRDRARGAAMQLLYSACDGQWPRPPDEPNLEPDPASKRVPAARPKRSA
jgi:hypothetical protein